MTVRPVITTSEPVPRPSARVKTVAKVAKVTKRDLNLLKDFVREMGLETAAVEATPGRIRVITTAGRNLTLPDDEESLRQELAEHRATHGYG